MTLPRVVKTNRASLESLRSKLLEMKQAERVPVLSMKTSKMYQRRVAKGETMAESWEAQGPVVKD